MSDILSQMFTTPIQIILSVVVILLILLWLFSIVWVHRDAKRRSTSVWLWTIIAIVPVAGLVAYCLLRPPYTSMDEDEQGMELSLIQRQLEDYGNCPHCGYPIESEFVICPNCRTRLRTRCVRCGHTLKPEWSVCPYCATPVGAKPKPKKSRPANAQKRGQDAGADGNVMQATQPQAPVGRDPFEPSTGN